MIKKIVVLMTIFLAFDRFIQHKINNDQKQRLVALSSKQKSFNQHDKRGKRFFAKVS